MSALHFSSGSIDLLGYFPGRELVTAPLQVLPDFIRRHPDHPYAACGLDGIIEAVTFFQNEVAAEQLALYTNESDNHFHITAIGTLKPAFLSPVSVFSPEIKAAFEKKPSIAIINIRGFRDFHPQLAAANLKKNAFFAECGITCREIELPDGDMPPAGIHKMRSVDVARLFDHAPDLEKLARRIIRPDENVHVAGLPAFLGIDRYREVRYELQRVTGALFYEVPTLPPSILGMRLDNALKSRFSALGGVFIAGETVDSGFIENNRVTHIHTSHQDDQLQARYYVLASGSFFSKGLSSRVSRLTEPVFNLEVADPPNRAAPSFFSPDSHNFLRAGVITDPNLHPRAAGGKTVENLFCVGAVLANYNPVSEGSGSGVAISTGYRAGQLIASSLQTNTAS